MIWTFISATVIFWWIIEIFLRKLILSLQYYNVIMSFCSSLLKIADFKAADFLNTFFTRLSAAIRSLLSLVSTNERPVFRSRDPVSTNERPVFRSRDPSGPIRSLLSLVMACADDRGFCNLNLDFLKTTSVLSAFPEFWKIRNRQTLLGIEQRNSIFRKFGRKLFYQQVTLIKFE